MGPRCATMAAPRVAEAPEAAPGRVAEALSAAGPARDNHRNRRGAPVARRPPRPLSFLLAEEVAEEEEDCNLTTLRSE